ncbi:polymer-forming cytoskeletal protein [Sphingomonas sp.]|uniref:bactofilin family protein n=1 Tax=Sphingomonas sp. TaxID=28214 RepID=UPI0025E9ACFE|nr:polymer-forming cytoskeletal protein [Sphingomonas sp.]
MFGKSDKTMPRSPAGKGLSFIGSDVIITGNIGGHGHLHIDGRVDGDVVCAALTLGADGVVAGNVSADDATIAGTIDGTIAAKALTIEGTARINGDLSYDSVSIATGAIVEGRVKRLSREDSGSALKLIASD